MEIRTCVLDTSVVIAIYDKNKDWLLEYIFERYERILIPWIVEHEYLYGHEYIGEDITRKKFLLEQLGEIVFPTQDIVMRAVKLDVNLAKEGMQIPFGDIYIAAVALTYNADLVTLDVRHYERVKDLKVVVPKEQK
ncbi:MAG: type II toxin-antitoxin system VapC family toxin [Candidatus Baldrarchaeia archaeon]